MLKSNSEAFHPKLNTWPWIYKFFSCFLLPNFLYHTVSFLEQYHQLLLYHPCWTYRSKVMVLKLVSQHWSWQLRRVMMCWLLVCSVFSLVSHFLKVCFLCSFLYLFLISIKRYLLINITFPRWMMVAYRGMLRNDISLRGSILLHVGDVSLEDIKI